MAEIVKIEGVNSYLVKHNGKLFKRHANHLSSSVNIDKIGNGGAQEKDNEIRFQNNLKQVLKEHVKVNSNVNDNVEKGSADMAKPVEQNCGEIQNPNPHVDVVVEEQMVPLAVEGALNADGLKRTKRQIKKPNRLNL